MVVFPRSTADVAGFSHRRRTRDSGGGPRRRHGPERRRHPARGRHHGGFARMNRIEELDLENERAVVQPGVVNLDVTLAVQADRLFLRARPLQPAGLHHRRQRGRERRRPAHARLRRDHQPRARARVRAARRHASSTPAARSPTCPATTSPACSPAPKAPWRWSRAWSCA